jgi:hypothetical protein
MDPNDFKTKLLTNCNTVLFLFGGQKPRHKLCNNVVHVQITCENCLHCSIWHINNCNNVLNGSRRSLRISCRIVSTFLGVELVEGRSDLSLSLSDVLPLLKHACHSKHLAFPYARRIISKVSTPDLPSLTQNLKFATCSSFTSMLKSQTCSHRWWQTLVLCNSQRSHSNATWHTEWWCSLLPTTAHAFIYCHRLVFYRTSLKTFWYTYVTCMGEMRNAYRALVMKCQDRRLLVNLVTAQILW